MTTNRQDDLSFHMRIPAKKCFANNVLLTIEGISDHFCFTETSRDRIKKVLETILLNSIDLFYQKEVGLFDLQFSIYKNKLMVLVEDYLLNANEEIELQNSNNEQVRNMLKQIEEFTDGMSFSEKKGCNSCYSLSFNVSFLNTNNEVPS